MLHGQFSFTGTLDTVRMANLFMDEQSVLPVVLESGVINIKIDQAKQVVSGTPLNEKLYAFLDKHRQLDNRMNELNHRQSQMMLDGIDEDTIQARLSAEAEQIIKEEDRFRSGRESAERLQRQPDLPGSRLRRRRSETSRITGCSECEGFRTSD